MHPKKCQKLLRSNRRSFYLFTYFISVILIFKSCFNWSFLNRFVVREFTYNEEELAAGKNEITKLVTDKKKQFVSTVYVSFLKHSF